MKVFSKKLFFIILVLALLAGLLCALRNQDKIPPDIMRDVDTSSGIVLMNVGVHAPYNRMATYLKVVTWLREATVYHGEIPKGDDLYFSIHVGPPEVLLSTRVELWISPACYFTAGESGSYSIHYIKNVVEVLEYGKTCYIRSPQMYDWLMSERCMKECYRKEPDNFYF